MPHPIELKERVLGAIDEGMGKYEAHKIFKVARSTIDRWIELREKTGSLEVITDYVRGPKPAIETNAETKAFFDEYQHKTLEQLRNLWFEEKGELLSDVTFSKTLRRMGYTRKKNLSISRSE